MSISRRSFIGASSVMAAAGAADLSFLAQLSQAAARDTTIKPDDVFFGRDGLVTLSPVQDGTPSGTFLPGMPDRTFSLEGTVVPEPATLLLCGAGLAAGVARRYRRKE